MLLPAILALFFVRVNAHASHRSDEFYPQAKTFQQHLGMDVVDVSTEPWTSKYGPQFDLGYTGPLSFSHLPYSRCLDDGVARFDIGLLGMPFDTTTSFRPGARFGPFAIRSGSRRQGTDRGTLAWGTSPGELGAALLDCGDVTQER